MRSLSSTVSDKPSSWLPSRKVVSKISTASGSARTSADIFVPVLVPIDLTANGGEKDVVHPLGDRTGLTGADNTVVDGLDRDDLGGRSAQERLVGGVQIAAQEMADLDVDALVAGDGEHRALRDSFQGAGRDRRRDDPSALDDEDVLARALAHVPLGRQHDGFVVTSLERLDFGHRRVDVHTGAL